MLRLTEAAVAHLRRLRQTRGLPTDSFPRFERRNGRLNVDFQTGPNGGDRLVNAGRMAVLIAPTADDLLRSAIIDVGRSEGKPKLVVERSGRLGRRRSPDIARPAD